MQVKTLMRKWIKALRSGQYRQAKAQLVSHDFTKFCCLGVYADVQGVAFVDDDSALPKPDCKRPGRGFFLPAELAPGLTTSDQARLSRMNDRGASFKEIADHIEQVILPRHLKRKQEG